jgi:hypothetical protein
MAERLEQKASSPKRSPPSLNRCSIKKRFSPRYIRENCQSLGRSVASRAPQEYFPIVRGNNACLLAYRVIGHPAALSTCRNVRTTNSAGP